MMGVEASLTIPHHPEHQAQSRHSFLAESQGLSGSVTATLDENIFAQC